MCRAALCSPQPLDLQGFPTGRRQGFHSDLLTSTGLLSGSTAHSCKKPQRKPQAVNRGKPQANHTKLKLPEERVCWAAGSHHCYFWAQSTLYLSLSTLLNSTVSSFKLKNHLRTEEQESLWVSFSFIPQSTEHKGWAPWAPRPRQTPPGLIYTINCTEHHASPMNCSVHTAR